MLKRTLSAIAASVMIAASLGAQTRPAKPTPAPAPKEATPRPAPAPTAEAVAVPRPEPQGQAVNVRLELTIADQMGPGEPTKKVITMNVADRQNGFIRSKAMVRAATGPNSWQYRDLTINVDARPTILRDGNVRVDLGLEYQPTGPASGGQPPQDPGLSNLNERISVIVEPGKPLTISQAADPTSDRRITVDLKATILR